MMRYILYPIFLIISLSGIKLIEESRQSDSFVLLLGAILLMFIFEALNTYEESWKVTTKTFRRDLLHFLTNHSLLVVSLMAISSLGLNQLLLDFWPEKLNFFLQVFLAIFILDFGITMTHYFSHKSDLLWKFHELHHSLQGLYGFNGLMKHPLHQGLESMMGVLPLLLIGVPGPVLQGVTFCVSIQLLLQHSNVDYTVGPLRPFLAVAENHRFHHLKGPAGNVNFGLFFTIWDHLLGTSYFKIDETVRDVGLIEQYPQSYLKQIIEPINRLRRKS